MKGRLVNVCGLRFCEDAKDDDDESASYKDGIKDENDLAKGERFNQFDAI